MADLGLVETAGGRPRRGPWAPVGRLRELGAVPVDIGQGNIPWVVLACDDFWLIASGWQLQWDRNGVVSLRSPSDSGAYLEFLPNSDPKRAKNRVHLDVAPHLDEDYAEAVESVLRSGAVRADLGQGDVSWAVLADPEANEFCVLSPS